MIVSMNRMSVRFTVIVSIAGRIGIAGTIRTVRIAGVR